MGPFFVLWVLFCLSVVECLLFGVLLNVLVFGSLMAGWVLLVLIFFGRVCN